MLGAADLTQQPSRIAIEVAERTQYRQRSSIPCRISDQQDQALGSAIARLQGKSPLDGLDIVERCLGLDDHSPVGASNDRIPSTEIARNRKWDLGPKRQLGMQPVTKSGDEALLRGVANGIASGISSDDEIQADDRTPGTQVRDRGVVDRPAFEAEHLLVGRVGGCADRAQTDAGTDAGDPVLPTEA